MRKHNVLMVVRACVAGAAFCLSAISSAAPNCPADRPPKDSIVVSQATNLKLCLQLILRRSIDGTESLSVDIPAAIGSIVTTNDWGLLAYFENFDDRTSHVSSVLFDIWDTGKPTAVYKFSSGGTFTEEFVVVPNPDATQAEVIQMAKEAGNLDATAQAARTKGWSVYTGAGTAYGKDGSINIELGRIRNTSYFLYTQSRGGPPLAVLVKPERAGKVKSICEFRSVEPH